MRSALGCDAEGVSLNRGGASASNSRPAPEQKLKLLLLLLEQMKKQPLALYDSVSLESFSIGQSQPNAMQPRPSRASPSRRSSILASARNINHDNNPDRSDTVRTSPSVWTTTEQLCRLARNPMQGRTCTCSLPPYQC